MAIRQALNGATQDLKLKHAVEPLDAPETTYHQCLEHLETRLADYSSRSLDITTRIVRMLHTDGKDP